MHNTVDIPYKWLLMTMTALLVIFLVLLGFQISDTSTVNARVSEIIQNEGGVNGKSLIDIENYLQSQNSSSVTYRLKTYDNTTYFPNVFQTKYINEGQPVNALITPDLPNGYGLAPYGTEVGYTLNFESTGGFFSIIQSLGGKISSLVLPLKNNVVIKSNFHDINSLDPYFRVFEDNSTVWTQSIKTNKNDNFSWAIDENGNAHVWSANGTSPINFKDGTLDLANNLLIKTITFDTPVIGTNFSKLFFNDKALTTVDFSNVDSSGVTDMSYMFDGDSALTSLDLSEFDTSMVTNMAFMFYQVSGLQSLDVSHFDTSKVSNMSSMFAGMSSLEKIEINNFDTSNVTNMSSMFASDTTLNELDLSHFNTLNVTDMSYMFAGLTSLVNLDLSSLDTSSLINFEGCFSNTSALVSLSLEDWDFSKVNNLIDSFAYDSSLNNVDLTGATFPAAPLPSNQSSGFSTNISSLAATQLLPITGVK